MKISGLKAIVFVSLWLCCTAVAATEEVPPSDWKKEGWDNFKSPVTTDGKYALLIGGALTATLLIFEDKIGDPFQNETVEDRPLGSYSKYGDLAGQGYPNAVYFLGMLGYGYFRSDPQATRDSFGMAQASIYSGLITTALKYSVREPRPYDGSVKNSFPSGHSTMAFAFASYIGCRHTLPWAIAAYSMAVFVAYSRINDNQHYLHDTVAGATIGESYGLGICELENRINSPSKEAPKASTWYLAPTEGGAMAGVTYSY